jgi:hypothetical protein
LKKLNFDAVSYFGNSSPFALNFYPNGVSAVPPVGFWWHCAHGLPVCAANFVVASAGRERPKSSVPAITIAFARTQVFVKCAFTMVSMIILHPKVPTIELAVYNDAAIRE